MLKLHQIMRIRLKIKKIFSIALFSIIMIGMIGFINPVFAADTPLDKLRQAINYKGNELLPDFDEGHPDCMSAAEGVANICSALLYTADFIKYIASGFAVLYIFVTAFRLITAGDKVDDEITKEKESVKYIIMGLLVIILSSSLINEVISSEGGIEFLRSMSWAEDSGQVAGKHIRGIANFIKIFIGAIAILVIIVSGLKLLTSGGADDVMQAQKRHIIWAMVGLVVIGIAELLVNDIIFAEPDDPGTEFGYGTALKLIADITTFMTSFISFIAILAIIYAGYLYVTARGEEEPINTAKKILWGVVIGIILTAASYAIVNTLIGLKT